MNYLASTKTIYLVGCGKQKLSQATFAKDIYTSYYFCLKRQYAETFADSWFIISAKHHLLSPDQIIEPYDETLKGAGVKAQKDWAAIGFPNEQFKRPYSLYFEAISKTTHVRFQGAREREVLIVCEGEKADTRKSIPRKEFISSCNQFQTLIPDGLIIHIHRIKPNMCGQEVHNRYILSDIGGVSFGHGTDASRTSGADSYDDITLLDKTQWQHWRKAYTPGSPFFDWSEPPVMVNRRSVHVIEK